MGEEIGRTVLWRGQRRKMVHLFGRFMDKEMAVWKCLTGIAGIGPKKALLICAGVGVMPKVPWKALTEEQSRGLAEWLQEAKDHGVFRFGPEYQRFKKEKESALVKSGTWRGERLLKGLPVNGQQSHRNAKTCRKLRVRGFEVSARRNEVARNRSIKKPK